MRHEHDASFRHHARIDSALFHHVAPDLFAGLRLDGVDPAVAQALNQESHAIDGRDDRPGIGRVVGAPTWVGHINDISRSFIERDEAVRPIRHRAPVRDRRTDDHEVAVDNRGLGPSAVGGEGGKLFTNRPMPHQLAVLVQAQGLRAPAERIDVSRFRIDHRRRPAHTVRGNITLKDVELVFPHHLAGVGVERHHPLLLLLEQARRILDVHPVAEDDRRRSAAVRRPPQEVLAVQRNFFRQSRLLRRAVVVGPSRLGPVAQRDALRPVRRDSSVDAGHQGRDAGDESDEKRALFQHDSILVTGCRPPKWRGCLFTGARAIHLPARDQTNTLLG